MHRRLQTSSPSRGLGRLFWLAALLLAVCGVLGLWFLCSGRQARTEATEPELLQALVNRLEKAYVPALRLGGMNLHQPEMDATVREEVKAKGRMITPYLVAGLSSPSERMRVECASMLGIIPSKEGLRALVACLGDDTFPEQGHVVNVLAHMTGLRLEGANSDTLDLGGDVRRWRAWWKANEGRIADSSAGVVLKMEDGSLLPLCYGGNETRFFVAEGDAAAVRGQLAGNPGLASKDSREGVNLLLLASEKGHVDIVGMLLDCGTDVNAHDLWFCTALHKAAWFGHVEVAVLLLKKGADASAVTSWMGELRTAVELAEMAGNKEVLDLLK